MNLGRRFLLAVAIGGLAGCSARVEPMVVRPHAPQAYRTPQDAARAVAASQAAQAAAKGVRGNVLYKYYPGAQVYYAPERNCYIWHGTNGWIVTADAPKHLVLGAAKDATVDLESSGPMVTNLGKQTWSTVRDVPQKPSDKPGSTDQNKDEAEPAPKDEPN